MDKQHLKDLKIVIIDESDGIKEALKTALAESEGCQIVGMADGADEGLRLVIREDPDVVLMDVSPPHPALGLLRGIRKADQRVIIIIFTANNSAEMRAECREAGATFYVIKWQLGDLLALLQLARKLT